ncbi:MAG: methylmalonyl Co-A mutase-associated GTPase MeaB [Desulfobulbaceae bacterium]|nr:methylmalonyl Co-A mutase-associated GTPase MeaB [Desulfobulbaceae bacterium]
MIKKKYKAEMADFLAVNNLGKEYEGRRALHKVSFGLQQGDFLSLFGPNGAGKSTLVNALALRYAQQGLRTAVLAVDPSSPFTGGALLGDRVRMAEVQDLGKVYIRSMATRGSLGGLARATIRAADLLDALGFDVVLVETVGVGQIEVDVLEVADTVLVVLVPESGDGVQAMKAGLMEIADVIVVNKADREGAERMVRDIQLARDLGGRQEGWIVPVLTTVALRGEGVEGLMEALARHLAHLKDTGELDRRRKARLWQEFEDQVREALWQRFLDRVGGEPALKRSFEAVLSGEKSLETLLSAAQEGGGSHG